MRSREASHGVQVDSELRELWNKSDTAALRAVVIILSQKCFRPHERALQCRAVYPRGLHSVRCAGANPLGPCARGRGGHRCPRFYSRLCFASKSSSARMSTIRINYDYQASTSLLALPADALEDPSILVGLGCFFDDHQPGDILQLAPAFYLPHNIRYNQQFPATSAERTRIRTPCWRSRPFIGERANQLGLESYRVSNQ
jgi:hypothetical protein